MTLRLPRFALLALTFALPIAQAQVLPPTAAYSIALNGGAPVYDKDTGTQTFGTHSISKPGGVVMVDLSPASASFAMATSDLAAAWPNVSASINTQWMVASANNAPVLLNITISGWLEGQNTLTPDQLNTYNNLPPNRQRGAIKGEVAVRNGLNGSVTQLSAGLQSGIGFGVTEIVPDEHFTQQNGGYSTLSGSFSQTFSVWAQPNHQNSLNMSLEGDVTRSNTFTMEHASETFQLAGATRVTIAAAYPIDGVTITAVPEPGSAALAAAGLLAIGLRLRRRPA